MPSLRYLLAAGLLLGLTAPTAAQSLTPFEKTGVTPSDRKAFKLQVGNPYDSRMVFKVVPMQPDYETPAGGAVVKPTRLVMAPGITRQVIFTFDIDPARGERTIALCVTPEAMDGPILPRVCGLYTGRMAGTGG